MLLIASTLLHITFISLLIQEKTTHSEAAAHNKITIIMSTVEDFLKVKRAIGSIDSKAYIGDLYLERSDDNEDDDGDSDGEGDDGDDGNGDEKVVNDDDDGDNPKRCKRTKIDADGKNPKQLIQGAHHLWCKMNDEDEYLAESHHEPFDFIHHNGRPLPRDPDELLALCKQSPFGDLRTNTTKVDLSVRNAFEICEGLELTLKGRQLVEKMELDVSKILYNGDPIKMKINKLNVYGKGGMFLKHHDTPREGVIGTFIFQLDYDFSGDGLVVEIPRSNDKPARYCVKSLKNKFVAFAFYSYLAHWVDEVKDGLRVTVSLYITKDTASSSKGAVSPCHASSSPLYPTILDSTVDNHSKDASETLQLLTTPSMVDTSVGVGITESLDVEDRLKKKTMAGLCGQGITIGSDELYFDWSATRSHTSHKHILTMLQKICNMARDIVKADSKLTSRPIGFLLRHIYSNDEFFAGHYKGIDALLIKCLERMCCAEEDAGDLAMEKWPVLINYQEEEEYYESGITRTQHVYRFLPEDIEFYGKHADRDLVKPLCYYQTGGHDSHGSHTSGGALSLSNDVVQRLICKPESHMSRDLATIVASYTVTGWSPPHAYLTKTKFVGDSYTIIDMDEDPGAEHTGNESRARSVDNHYYSNVVIVYSRAAMTAEDDEDCEGDDDDNADDD